MGKIISNGIEYGGLIKVEGALIKEIWVNDNVQPIGVFSINLDLSDYDFVGFRFEQNTSDMGKITPIQIVKNELGGTVFVFNASGGSSAVIGRSATITSTGITFSDGYVPNVKYYNNLLVPVTIYGIQQGSGANNGGIDYSTTEQKTGQKWVDGKDIYQKTYVTITDTQYSSENAYLIGTIPNGLDNVVDFEGSLKTSDGYGYSSLNGIGNITNWNFGIHISNTNLLLYGGSSFSSLPQNATCIVTIKYTKSTT